MTYKSIQSLLKTAGVNLLVVSLFFVVLEAILRISYSEITDTGTDRSLFADSVFGPTPALRPNASGYSNGALLTTTAAGTWKYSSKKSRDRTWLLIGDSVTMGIGVDPDSTLGGRLELLQDSLSIANISKIGYSSQDYLSILRGLSHRADIARVTIIWCLNDIYQPTTVDPGSTIRDSGGQILSFLKRKSRIYHLLKATLLDRPRAYFDHDLALYSSDGVSSALGDRKVAG